MSTRKANENNLSVRKDMRIDKELLQIIDSVRGDVPFAAWVKRAAIQRLTSEGIAVPDKISGGSTTPIVEIKKIPVKTKNIESKPKPRYTWITPQGEFSGRTSAVKASGVKADSLTKLCDSEEDNGYSRVPW